MKQYTILKLASIFALLLSVSCTREDPASPTPPSPVDPAFKALDKFESAMNAAKSKEDVQAAFNDLGKAIKALPDEVKNLPDDNEDVKKFAARVEVLLKKTTAQAGKLGINEAELLSMGEDVGL